MQFAKIIEVDGLQVLFYREPDTDAAEDDREILHQIVHVDGVCADLKFGNMTEQATDAVFSGLDKDKAASVIRTVRNILNPTDDEE